jgi:cob(I)alamin adenosyltransferase
MTRPTRIEKNCTTGEEFIIELTDEEIAEMEVARQASLAREAEREAALAATEAAKASAQAKLSALGLTSEEIAALSK